MSAVAYSKPDFFFAPGMRMSTLSIAGTSIPVKGDYGDVSSRRWHSDSPSSSKIPIDEVRGFESSPSAPTEAESTADLVKQIKRRGAYTWDQVAKLFGVSRRTVHLWASGGKISAVNEEALGRVMRQIEAIEEAGEHGARFRFLALLDQQRSQHASSSADVNRPASTYAPEP